MDTLGTKLNITSLEEWYNVPLSTVVLKNKGNRLLSYYGYSPFKLLKACYPQYPAQSCSDEGVQFNANYTP